MKKRLVPVVGDAGLHVRTAKPATITPFRKDLTTDGTDGTDASPTASNKLQSVKSVKSVVEFCCLRVASLRLLSVHYGASTIRKWLIISPLQPSAFFRIFPLTSILISYIIARVW